ncbi:hypothetical protein THIAE_08055 [Thiomicrospira aerophila AL3]|uniref:AB hydrolase-1 domain-containing protein n=1 Tax=Thiomicrospira aerophila AL3 TaxID=717772 RepID=W0DZD7_9GAMM|nr:alpha/beta fold hydrolase [Thiomicrospira aerophila]AHF02349.1 hypothetical protein THIAE_08055 [Thiomicrospira aerophila AL3]
MAAKLRLVMIVLALWPVSQYAKANIVYLESQPGFFLQAKFVEPVVEDKNLAVLVLHGFLTTNNFHTINSLMAALNDQGIAALAPNLSYGISARQASMSCNSLHTHTLEDNRAEIDLWLDWLVEQGYRNIVLLGHSSGSQYIIFSQATEPHSAVVQLILTSMFYFGDEDIGTKQEDLQRARYLMLMDNPNPALFSLMFCEKDYFATPASFLSYIQLTRAQTAAYMQMIKVPVEVVMGGEDEILHKIKPGWLDEMRSAHANVQLIEGANHFFSSLYEFDLQERIADILKQVRERINNESDE